MSISTHLSVEVKCLSLYLPWALLCVLPGDVQAAMPEKQYETRSWMTRHRGPLVIHAAKRWTAEEQYTSQLPEFRSVLKKHGWGGNAFNAKITGLRPMPLGCAVGVVYMEDCIFMTKDFIAEQTPQEKRFGNWQPGRWVWKFSHPRLFPMPIQMTGNRLLFAPSNTVLHAVQGMGFQI